MEQTNWKKLPWGSVLRPTTAGIAKGLKSDDFGLFIGFQDSAMGGYVKVLRFGRQSGQPYAVQMWQVFREEHFEALKGGDIGTNI